MIFETQESLKKYRADLKEQGYPMYESVSNVPVICSCGSGLYLDRRIEQRMGCPACDPELGGSIEERLHNYKMLIATPFNEEKNEN